MSCPKIKTLWLSSCCSVTRLEPDHRVWNPSCYCPSFCIDQGLEPEKQVPTPQ
ncbi:hypothetical protein SLEP1_g47310 [Rubroshorea leprosula]|uniref:Uncharacterized protein n=1 Tax=Rubroshorea leprosula TaxID=152421 RepID=A0AAV5LST1_9ROSI|nr:hypothetical protein SLEP1_g47310 [Rubroshorea leprosula]